EQGACPLRDQPHRSQFRRQVVADLRHPGRRVAVQRALRDEGGVQGFHPELDGFGLPLGNLAEQDAAPLAVAADKLDGPVAVRPLRDARHCSPALPRPLLTSCPCLAAWRVWPVAPGWPALLPLPSRTPTGPPRAPALIAGRWTMPDLSRAVRSGRRRTCSAPR